MAYTEIGDFEIIVDVSCQTSIIIGGRKDPKINLQDNRYVAVYPRIKNDVNNKFAQSSWFVQVYKGKEVKKENLLRLGSNELQNLGTRTWNIFEDPEYAICMRERRLNVNMITFEEEWYTFRMWPGPGGPILSGNAENDIDQNTPPPYDVGEDRNTDYFSSLCLTKQNDRGEYLENYGADIKSVQKQKYYKQYPSSDDYYYEETVKRLWSNDQYNESGNEVFKTIRAKIDPSKERLVRTLFPAKTITVNIRQAISCPNDTPKPPQPDPDEPDPPGSGKPSSLNVSIIPTVRCTGVGDERLLKAEARVSDDPRNRFAQTKWMVQWFRSDSGIPNDRRYSNLVKEPRWKNTEVIADWTNRNPGAFLIRGNVAQIIVDRKECFNWTVWMWPGESNTEDKTEIDGENKDFGPTVNRNELRSLSLIKFNSNNIVETADVNGVYEVQEQRTTGKDYFAEFELFWSGKENYTKVVRNSGEYVYWYLIDSKHAPFNTEDKSCSGDTDLTPTPEPEPEPEPPTKATISITCGNVVGDQLRASISKCSGEKSFQWQKLVRGTWEDIKGETKAAYTPEFPGTYRCKGKCDDAVLRSSNCFIDEAPPTPQPEPEPPESCTFVKMDWPGAPNFPLYAPSGRSYTLGDFPVTFEFCTKGNDVAIQRGNQLVQSKITLRYENVSDRVAMDFITHFNTFGGTSNYFKLNHTGGNQGPAAGLQVLGDGNLPAAGGRNPDDGSSRTLFWGGEWRYQQAPRVRSVRPGISTVDLVLLRRAGITSLQDGSEAPWKDYPKFPFYIPSARTLRIGDWNTAIFKSPDGVETGRLYGPQRNTFLDLTYEAMPDMEASSFFRHFIAQGGQAGKFGLTRSNERRGVFGGFDPGILNPNCKQFYEDKQWCYAASPVMTSVRKGLSTVRVRLRCPFVAPQFVREVSD